MIIAAAHDLTRNHSVLRPVSNTRATAQVQASQVRRAGHAQEGFDEWFENLLCQENAAVVAATIHDLRCQQVTRNMRACFIV